jgi:hypothetical protein
VPHEPARGGGATFPLVALDWNKVAALDAAEIQQVLLRESDSVMRPYLDSPDDQDRVLATLPDPVRTMWLINWLDFEVSQGSLLAYFYNSHGRHAPEAAQVLERIGASRMAEVVREAIRVREREAPDMDEQLEVLTDRYWEAAASDGWGDLLDQYLVAEVRAQAP